MKKTMLIFTLAIAALGLGLAACGGDDDQAAPAPAAEPATPAEEPAAPAEAPTGEALDVRVITATPTTAGSWDPQHFKTYTAVSEEMGWNLEIAEAIPYGEADQVLARWGGEGVDIVYSTDNGFQDNMLAAAAEYPDTIWATMSDLSTTNDLANVAAYTVEWCEFGYVQGAVAASLSESGMIGGVAAIPILPATKSILGFQFSADLTSSGSTLEVTETGDFSDAVKAQEATSALIDAGADVIVAITQGGVSPQIAARTQENDKIYIGSYGDEAQFAPEATVTSVVLKFDQGYRDVAQQVLDGNFQPGIFRLGAADGFIEVLPWAAGFEDANATADAVIDMLVNGEVTIPDDCLNAS